MIYGSDIDFNNHLKIDYSKEPGRIQKKDCLVQPVVPHVSIITATYNTSEYIYKTAASIFNQTFPWFEWIIVDDGNTKPESLRILEALEGIDSRIRVVRQSNRGLGAARNNGIHQSSTDIILPLDDDDMIDPTFVETVYFTLLANPEASIAYTDTVGFEAMNYLWKAPFDLERMKKENVMCVCSGVRKQALLDIGLYEEDVRNINEDWHLWLRLLAKGNIPVHMGWFGFWYRRKNMDSLLAKIQSDPELMAANQKMLDAAIGDIHRPVEAVSYPHIEENQGFRTYSQWELPGREERDPGKTRILMILPWMIVGGADLFNLNLLKGLDKDKFDAYVMTSYNAEQELRQEFAEHARGVYDLTSFLDTSSWPSFLDCFIKIHNIDTVFVSNNFFGYYVIPWLKKNNPELKVMDYVHAEFPWRNGAYARTTGVLDHFIDRTYVCNEYTRGLLNSRYSKPLDKISTIYIGVDEVAFDPEKYSDVRIREEFGIRDDQKAVVYPCRIEEEKRPFLMLEIAAALKAAKDDEFIFLVVGDGGLLPEMKEAAEASGLGDIVRFAGKRSDMPEIYCGSDLTLICSVTEGLSLTAYESLSMKVPCITSDVGGQSELVDNETGRLIPCSQDPSTKADRKYPAEEVGAYVQAIISLTADPEAYEALRENCRRRILDGFSIRNMVDRFEREFSCRSFEGSGHGSEIGLMADDYLNLYFQYDALDRQTQWKQETIDRLTDQVYMLTVEQESLISCLKLVVRRLKTVIAGKLRI